MTNFYKTLKVLFLGILVLFIASGCIYQNTRYPGLATNVTVFELDSDDFKILGTVETEGVYTTWFGLVLTSETGYSELLAKSKKMGGDEIMNYRFEIQEESILMLVYNRVVWKAWAQAIQYKSEEKE